MRSFIEAEGRAVNVDLFESFTGDNGKSHKTESRLCNFEAGREKLRGGEEY